MPVEVPLGDGTIEVSLPTCTVRTAIPPGGDPIDLVTASRRALDNPHGPRLGERVDSDDSVSIVVTDGTRATPEDVLLEPLIDDLARAGVSREQIQIVVGLGLHRPMSDDEIEAALGEYASLAVNHDPDDTVEIGRIDGCSIEIFEPVARSDVVCSTGMVEPHQYAGFSGGAKTAIIGAGGESQIRYTHGPEMLAREGVRLGRYEDNPFRSFLDRAGDLLGVEFCLNVTHGPAGITGVSAGDPRAVVQDLAATARETLSVPVEQSYDAVIAGVRPPKDVNLYQASRAPTYLVLGASNPLREGGRVVVPARLSEGAGDGRGERRFYDRLASSTDAESLYREMREGYEPGAQRAFVLARVLRSHDVWLTNSQAPEVVENCLMNAAPTVDAAVDSESDVLVVPDALNTLLVSA